MESNTETILLGRSSLRSLRAASWIDPSAERSPNDDIAGPWSRKGRLYSVALGCQNSFAAAALLRGREFEVRGV
jgi:hypothetical protein